MHSAVKRAPTRSRVGNELLSLMIIDDERAVRETCREAGVTLGYQTFATENPYVAYRLLEAHGIDIVLLDLRLPSKNGMEVLREIKRRRPQTECIVITGKATVRAAGQGNPM